MALLETSAPQTGPRETKRQTEQPVVTLPSPDAHARLLFLRPAANSARGRRGWKFPHPSSPQGLEAPAAAARRPFRFVREAAEASVIRDRHLSPSPTGHQNPLDPHRRRATLCPCSVPAGSWPGLTMGGSEAPGQLDEAILKPRAHKHHHHQPASPPSDCNPTALPNILPFNGTGGNTLDVVSAPSLVPFIRDCDGTTSPSVLSGGRLLTVRGEGTDRGTTRGCLGASASGGCRGGVQQDARLARLVQPSGGPCSGISLGSRRRALGWVDAEKGRTGGHRNRTHEPPTIKGMSKLLALDEEIDKLESPLLMQLQDTAGFSGW